MSQFKTRLKELRTERNYTQEQLAKLLNTSRSRIGMYENGNREPDFETQEAIADLFNVDMDYLLGRSNDKHAVHIRHDSFDDFEINLIKDFNNADADTQKMIINLLAFSKKMKQEENGEE